MNYCKNKIFAILCFSLLIIFSSCSVTKQINKQANTILLKDSAIATGNIGISIYEPAANKYWYGYNSSHYFVPASNTKLFSLYAGMKYLGDSLVGLRYEKKDDSTINIIGTGDPTFLLAEFKSQPVFSFLKKFKSVNYLLGNEPPYISPLGFGWPIDDFLGDYAAERNEMPIYGNVAKFYMQADTLTVNPPFFFNDNIKWLNGTLRNGVGAYFDIVRPFENNAFHSLSSNSKYKSKTKFTIEFVPFKTSVLTSNSITTKTFIKLLGDTLRKNIGDWSYFDAKPIFKNIIHSQPTDSLFKPMMHRSDNFFAEQTLLMASNEHLGYMNDEKIIDTILNSDLKDIPQRPKWVDGSGLSRYNLFTPQDFVYILNKLKNEFGFDRMKNILATGGTGTIANYYKKDAGFIFAKTGTLSNNCALSGYLITKKGKLLIFSVLANNYITGATPIRRAVEQFLQQIRDKY